MTRKICQAQASKHMQARSPTFPFEKPTPKTMPIHDYHSSLCRHVTVVNEQILEWKLRRVMGRSGGRDRQDLDVLMVMPNQKKNTRAGLSINSYEYWAEPSLGVNTKN
nr:PREDICTED: uncharacterized protein LOC103314952 [Tribolium castaneum]|eukprot:XP_008200530.1 PREDICTED: uncharacterized protein LOC103314952 [Tribolium castaneum]